MPQVPRLAGNPGRPRTQVAGSPADTPPNCTGLPDRRESTSGFDRCKLLEYLYFHDSTVPVLLFHVFL